MYASRESSPDIMGDNDEDRSSGAPHSPTADSDTERPLSSTQMTQSISQSCSGSGSPSPGLRLVRQCNHFIGLYKQTEKNGFAEG